MDHATANLIDMLEKTVIYRIQKSHHGLKEEGYLEANLHDEAQQRGSNDRSFFTKEISEMILAVRSRALFYINSKKK
jgi:hypothetical protein